MIRAWGSPVPSGGGRLGSGGSGANMGLTSLAPKSHPSSPGDHPVLGGVAAQAIGAS